MTSDPPDGQNGLLVASRWQFDRVDDQHQADYDRERWLPVRVSELDLDLLVVHIPGGTDNKFKDGYGISGAKRKELLWERAVAYAVDHRDHRAIMVGDFNTGLQIDAEGTKFVMSHYMTNLIDTGFVDTWRHLNPSIREYTWYSKRKDKTTGASEDLNGFRLDYIFVSPALQHVIAEAAIFHEPRRAGVSDHASVVAEIDIRQEGAHRTVPSNEMPTVPASLEERIGDRIGRATGAGDGPPHTEVAPNGNRRVRFDLAPGDLPVMTCGINGRGLVQDFRPTYVTAEWTRGVLKEVRIWGPRVLQDGSLGRRELDHVWTGNVATGGVKFSDLPFVVAKRLQS